MGAGTSRERVAAAVGMSFTNDGYDRQALRASWANVGPDGVSRGGSARPGAHAARVESARRLTARPLRVPTRARPRAWADDD